MTKSSIPCPHFPLGRCINGSFCDYYHDPADDPAQPIDESDGLAILYRDHPETTPCWFFKQGHCKWEECCFACQKVIMTFSELPRERPTVLMGPTIAAPALSNESQTMGSTTNSAPPSRQASDLGPTFIQPLAIGPAQLLPPALRQNPTRAIIQSQQPGPTIVTKRFESTVSMFCVVCTWLQKSVSASVQFDSPAEAFKAEKVAKSFKIRGNFPKCALRYSTQEVNGRWPVYLKLYDLAIDITYEEIMQLFKGRQEPTSILVERIHIHSSINESANLVEELMRSQGNMAKYEYHVTNSSAMTSSEIKVKAIATFETLREALDAAEALNGKKISGLSNQPLVARQAVIGRCIVPTVVLHTLEEEIKSFIGMIWDNGRVHMKVTVQPSAIPKEWLIDISDPADSLTLVRLFADGKDTRSVQNVWKAAGAFEQLVENTFRCP